MASIRTRAWRKNGKRQTAVVVDYFDIDGRRRLQTFNTEAAAVAFKDAITKANLKERPKRSMTSAHASVSPSASNDDDVLDALWGARAIAAFIKRSPRTTYHLLETGAIPAKKIGPTWVASRSKLRSALGA